MRLRRFISCVLAAITLFSLTACAGGNNSSKGMSDVTVEQTLKSLNQMLQLLKDLPYIRQM